MLLRDICTVDVVCCGPDTSAVDAARLMRERHVGDLVVVGDPDDGRAPIGIVTDRDLALGVLGEGLDAGTTKLSALLHHPVVIAKDTEDRSAIIERMRTHGVRRVPVVDEHGKVVGIITLDDLLRLCIRDANNLLEAIDKGQSRERHLRR